MAKLIISGASGRMGRALMRAAASHAQVAVVGAVEESRSAHLGKDANELAGVKQAKVLISAQTDTEFDVWIEFTTPAATLENLEFCRQQRRAMLIGTTGIAQSGIKQIHQAAREIPLIFAANTSVGINLCVALVEMASRILGADSDIEIVEKHHKGKIDAPSGTALLLGNTAAGARGQDLTTLGVFSRHGNTGARKSGTIGFSAVRGGDIAGEHSVLFIGERERLEITHIATNRSIFAEGAVRAAIWLAKQHPGLYSMRDVLGLKP